MAAQPNQRLPSLAAALQAGLFVGGSGSPDCQESQVRQMQLTGGVQVILVWKTVAEVPWSSLMASADV